MSARKVQAEASPELPSPSGRQRLRCSSSAAGAVFSDRSLILQ